MVIILCLYICDAQYLVRLLKIFCHYFLPQLVQNFDIEFNHGELQTINKLFLHLNGPLKFTFKDRKSTEFH